jgi:hypothetical protein
MAWRVILCVAALAVAGCADDSGELGAMVQDVTTTTAPPAATGPAAVLKGPLTAGKGLNLVGTRMPDLAAAGWVEEELTAEGTATSYRAVGELAADGHYELAPRDTAEYRTRIVVRRPADASDRNGTVVVEWLNVSGGLDAQPDFSYMADELIRGGYTWVGVSAQLIGVQGGEAAVSVAGAPTGGLRAADPERYGSLTHPGDAYAYDIYTQVGRALRSPAGVEALGGVEPARLLAVGESQSAFMLTTYVNGVQPLAGVYDGFLIHSRGGSAAPLGEPDKGLDIAGSIAGSPTRIRTDGSAPVLVVETETDVLSVLNYFPARQPDSDRFRLWEIAGTAHADAYLIGPLADSLDCGAAINAGPHHFVVKSALRHLDAWVRDGEAPPEAARLEVHDAGTSPVFVRDEDGNARGGIRTPQLDVPVATLSGEPAGAATTICLLLGSTIPLPEERLAARYETRADYLAAYTAAADAAIEAGFVLADDRDALLADAEPERIAP